MNNDFTAQATTTIDADKSKVWQALVSPKAVKAYMFGAEIKSDWQPGSQITWQGEFQGKKYEDKGEILQCEREKTLQYSHFSPLSGKPDKPENYHNVTIHLAGSGNKTEVSLSQDNNADEEARKEAEKTWAAMLEGLKKYVEKSA